MKSSSGAHYIALDHIRALAAFMVFVWHFTHNGTNGYPVSLDYIPTVFPFSIFDEGHTGVALFMTLSGYLFAKLLNGKAIDYKAFIWNRALRLLPLLMLVLFIVGITKFVSGQNLLSYIKSIAGGVVLPTLPNGGWSITVEFHYYIILPLFLWMLTKSKLLPFSIIIIAIALRLIIYYKTGEIQYLAYWTIIGRIDQFTFGMIIYQFRFYFINRQNIILIAITIFTIIYWFFDLQGGFYKNITYPSPSPLWIILPTIEGITYAMVIAWYDNTFSHSTSGLSKFIGKLGEYSYSIYLLHFFIVFRAAQFINEHIMNISNFYYAFIWSIIFFTLMIIPGYISFRFIESPFLKLRKQYIK